MSIGDLFVVIVMYIFISFYHAWQITFLGIYKATDKLEGNLINTQLLLRVKTVKWIVSLCTLLYTGRGKIVSTNLKMKLNNVTN